MANINIGEIIRNNFEWTWHLSKWQLIPYYMYLFSMAIMYALALFGAFVSSKFSIKCFKILGMQIVIFIMIGVVI